MSGFFVVGEKKERPGVYKRYENAGGVEAAGARSGVGCALVTGNWGALNTPVTIDQSTDISTVIGAGSGYDAITAFMAAGVEECVVVRVGNGGTPASITLKDTTASTAVDAVTLTGTNVISSLIFSILATAVKSDSDNSSIIERFPVTVKEILSELFRMSYVFPISVR